MIRSIRLIVNALIGSLVLLLAATAHADDVAEIVAPHIATLLNGPGGFAVAVRVDGRTWLANYGTVDGSAPVTSDALFNLGSVGKVFDTALLALADRNGELSLDDPVAKHVVELQQGGDIGRITLRQLATHTSGLVLAQDHPPWPTQSFGLPEFIATLNRWRADDGHAPGRQLIYSHAGFVLLHLALERRLGLPFDRLMDERLLAPLGLHSTTLPVASGEPQLNPLGEIPPALRSRAVQGYSDDGMPIGAPGDLQGYYRWLGTGQMYGSARDLAVFLAANLGELAELTDLQAAMRRAQQPAFPIRDGVEQALGWEVRRGGLTIVDKYGGMNNASAYVGLMPERKLGIVILGNRGGTDIEEAGRAILRALARR